MTRLSWYNVRIVPRGVVEFPDLPEVWADFHWTGLLDSRASGRADDI